MVTHPTLRKHAHIIFGAEFILQLNNKLVSCLEGRNNLTTLRSVTKKIFVEEKKRRRRRRRR